VDALVPAFLAALLAEFGDKTQLLTIILAARFGRPGPVLAGVAVAAIANSLIAAIGGALIAGMVPFRAFNLLLAIALIFAGGGALLPQKQPDMGIYDRLGVFVACLISFFILELGDKTQFLTFAFAARSSTPLLAGAGGAAGVIAASLPAVALGAALPKTLPLRPIRIGVGTTFLLVGIGVGLSALRLW
jgi:putative Ca2+/H+ antiporter (TMEM165/GDT1 family)